MGKTRFAPRLHDEWCQLRQWYQTPLGQRFYASELASLSSILPLLFGYHLLTVGTPVQGALISSPTRHQYHLDYYSSPRMGSVAKPHALGWASALPVASDSVDVLVLSHVFEVDPAPDAILAEVERVLIPEGHVVILGFSPLALWPPLWSRPPAPRSSRQKSPLRLKTQLAGLGFECVTVRHYHRTLPRFRLPPPAPRRLRALPERLGEGLCNAGYILVAKKRVSTLIPIRPRWRYVSRWKAQGVASPSSPRTKGSRRQLSTRTTAASTSDLQNCG